VGFDINIGGCEQGHQPVCFASKSGDAWEFGRLGRGDFDTRAQPCVVAIDEIGGNRYKILYYYESDAWELYDLSDDIGEANNLVEQKPELVSGFSKKIHGWLTQQQPTWKPKYPINKKTRKPIGPPPTTVIPCTAATGMRTRTIVPVPILGPFSARYWKALIWLACGVVHDGDAHDQPHCMQSVGAKTFFGMVSKPRAESRVQYLQTDGYSGKKNPAKPRLVGAANGPLVASPPFSRHWRFSDGYEKQALTSRITPFNL
jgi:hypothetical protein